MFEPQNPLEQSLVKAATDPAHRPQFYRDLIAAQVLILPVGEMPDIRDGVVQAGTQLALQHVGSHGRSLLAFFSAPSRIQAIFREERQYLALAVRSLFEITRGATLVLNPGSDYGKEFLPGEVAQILDGSIFQPTERHVVEKNTQILIGQPAKYPTKLVEALQHLYAKMPNVSAAHLAHYHDPSRDKEPGLLIAIDATGDWNHLSGESGVCSQGLTPDHHHVDFVKLQGSGLENYFAKNKPFYKKAGLLGRLFS